MRIFGSLWDAPVCEGKTAEPEPIGEFCIECDEMINVGDQGYIMACYMSDGSVEWRPQHKECSLLHVLGHSYGFCACTDYGGLSEREAGRRVWELVQGEFG